MTAGPAEAGGPGKSRCPTCRAEVEKPPPDSKEKSFYPFCSDRCRMVDLGRWLTGQYVIPGDPVQEEELPPAPKEKADPEGEEG